ncbi:hypothetical protein K440DRAFT_663641 [Wilcoxina mikolae CBS 423.85]|nr:hypothetical protein K440DRAFT_663641 [Wilcoxina mikolae CBS 423.85]
MSTPDEQISEVRYFEILPGGDMEIALHSDNENVTYLYIVSSLQLCACSSVFRAMLGPKSSFSEAVELRRCLETNSPDIYELKVQEHDPTALAAVLSVIHARTESLPDVIPFEGLLQVAIICDYYDCAAAMRPWDDMWMKRHKENAQTPGFESWLFIAQVFKEQDIFQELSLKIIRESIVEDGELKIVASGGEPTARIVKRLDKIPQNIVDLLLKQRNDLYKELLKIWREVYNRYDDDINSKCTVRPQSKQCDHFVFGELHHGLKAVSVPTEAQNHQWTPRYLVSTVETVLSSMQHQLNNYVRFNGNNHWRCAEFRHDVVKRMKDKLEMLQPPCMPTAKNTGAMKSSWDKLLLERSEYRRSRKVEV